MVVAVDYYLEKDLLKINNYGGSCEVQILRKNTFRLGIIKVKVKSIFGPILSYYKVYYVIRRKILYEIYFFPERFYNM